MDGQLQALKEIFTAYPVKDTLNHAGGHLAFLQDETLLITIGEGFEYKEQAQNLDSALGKIIRVNDDGTIPTDNPFINQVGERTAIWSYGHRNPLGLLHDAVTNTVYEHENGPKGGDELNIIRSGG